MTQLNSSRLSEGPTAGENRWPAELSVAGSEALGVSGATTTPAQQGENTHYLDLYLLLVSLSRSVVTCS